MEVVSLGTTPEGFPVVLDRHAAEADHIGVVARVKPHTGYHGPDRERPAEDDDDRPGQARRRPGLSPHPAGAALRPGRSLGRHAPSGTRRRSRSAWPSSRTPTTRRPASRRSCRPTSSRARKSCWCWPSTGWPGCRSTRPTCSSSTRSARTSAAPAWTPTSSAASGPSRTHAAGQSAGRCGSSSSAA